MQQTMCFRFIHTIFAVASAGALYGADAGVGLLAPGPASAPAAAPASSSPEAAQVDRVVVHLKVRGSGYLEGSPMFDRQAAVNLAKCSYVNYTVIHSSAAVCPPGCAFSQEVYKDPLSKYCVAAQLCGEYNTIMKFANPNTKTCTSTCGTDKFEKIPGCAVCASVGVCAKCSNGFDLDSSGRSCSHWLNRYFVLIYVVLALLCLLIAWYLFCLFRRPQINKRNLMLALQHRALGKPSRQTVSTQDGKAVWEAWPYLTNMFKEQAVAGQDANLFFRWLVFLFTVALVIFAFTYVAHEHSAYAEQAPTEKLQQPFGSSMVALYRNPKQDAEVEVVYEEHPGRMCIAFSLLYLVVLVMSLGMVFLQVGFSSATHRQFATPADYSVSIKGLPQDLRCPTPLHQHLDSVFFQKTSMSAVVGVSLNYNTRGYEDRIEEAIDNWIEELDIGMEDKMLAASQVEKGISKLASGQTWAGEKGHRECSLSSLDCIDYLLCGSASDAPVETEKAPEDLAWVHEISGSGEAIVTMNTQQLAHDLMKMLSEASCPAFNYDGKDYPLSAGYVSHSQPSDILWNGFHPRTIGSILCEALMVTVLLIIAILAFAIFYIPYAALYINFIHVPGVSPTTMQGTVIGFSIAIGNLIVSTIVEYAVGRASFRDKGHRDTAIMGLAFAATSLNLVADLCLVVQIVNGVQVDKAFAGTAEGYDRVLASHLYDLVIPGYLLIPILILPLAQIALPYWLQRGIVGSRRQGRRQSEKALDHPPFDIVWRYADCLTNTLIVFTLGAFTSPRMWMVSLWLALWFFLAMIIDHRVALRHSAQTYYSSCMTSNAFMVMWSVPTGGLAMLAAYWGFKFGVLPSIWLVPLAGILHIVLYAWGVHRVIYRRSDWREESLAQAPQPYSEVYAKRLQSGNPITYFNTNHVLCLRTRAEACKQLPTNASGWDVLMLQHAHSQEFFGCAPWVGGKGYLQPGEATTFDQGLARGLVEGLDAQREKLEKLLGRSSSTLA